MNLNKAMIIGNVTRDPDSRTTSGGQTVALFSVATNRAWTDPSGAKKEQVEFHSVVAWRKLAEIVSQYVKKGAKIFVEGRLQTRSWDDPSGQKKYRTEIVAENIIMLDRKPAADKVSEEAPAPQEAPAAAEPEINVEDIPF
ncbi:single-stranded DNA-binding protein [Candidatus Parcubacteria bacterium]|nr:MAG: single-stranded DNA-binding protein [Candidatus Parcubacteria bacterium]